MQLEYRIITNEMRAISQDVKHKQCNIHTLDLIWSPPLLLKQRGRYLMIAGLLYIIVTL